MKLKRKMTKSELETVGDIWYDRTDKLKELWQNEDTPLDKQRRAFWLWMTMILRIQYLGQLISKMNQPKIPDNIKRGGIVTMPKKAEWINKD